MAVIIEATDRKRLYIEVTADSSHVLPQSRLKVGWNDPPAFLGAEDHVHADLKVIVSHGEGL
jgi:hypothetical protein